MDEELPGLVECVRREMKEAGLLAESESVAGAKDCRRNNHNKGSKVCKCSPVQADSKAQEERRPGRHPSEWKPLQAPNRISANSARARLMAGGVEVRDPLGNRIRLDYSLVEHWRKAGKTEMDINRRLEQLPLIEAVISNPNEIWQDDNVGSLTYLAAVQDNYAERRYAVAFTKESDSRVLNTYWDNSQYIAHKRIGKLIHEKDL